MRVQTRTQQLRMKRFGDNVGRAYFESGDLSLNGVVSQYMNNRYRWIQI